MTAAKRETCWGYVLLALALLVVTAVYWPGLYGSWLFDDYPNIVDNAGLHLDHASASSLVNAALSSPASEFKRPLSSLSFAANYLLTGLDPFWMKLTNLVIHLANGVLVFFLANALFAAVARRKTGAPRDESAGITAAIMAAGWMLLPINLTGVLYVVQRMESLANLFVLLGLLGYLSGRRRMLYPDTALAVAAPVANDHSQTLATASGSRRPGFVLCVVSVAACTVVGGLAKETAVMLPLYACLTEWALFGFRQAQPSATTSANPAKLPLQRRLDYRIVALFFAMLVVPMMAGLAMLLPGLLAPGAWAARDFTLQTRLLTEARVVVDYIHWTLLPTPDSLSFYYDNFRISTSLMSPWTTAGSLLLLTAMAAAVVWFRRSRPLVALGIGFYLGCHLLTGTILPLELVYEHRNYFASFGLLLGMIPLLAGSPDTRSGVVDRSSSPGTADQTGYGETVRQSAAAPTFLLPRRVLLGLLMVWWGAVTALTAYAWGNPLRLARELAARAPDSPRAQYELGRTYIIYSQYDPSSVFTRLAYAPLEQSASLPNSSILAEQALIFMNSRMHLPLKAAWWDSMIGKLQARKSTVQDESSLGALTQCDRDQECDLPKSRMTQAYLAALSHPNPSARLLAMYGDYAWNVLDDHVLGQSMTADAVKTAPNEPAYRITLVRMLAAQGRIADAKAALVALQALDIGGRLDASLKQLRELPELR
ncbi:hypothetical protein [Rhodanobacter sp. BL-MT-08]